MKNTSFLWSYLIALMGGAALVVFNRDVNLFRTIVIIIGIVFILATLLMLGGIFFPGKKAKEAGVRVNPVIWGPIIGGGIFGILLVAMPDFFVHYLIYTFGLLLIVCGIIQISDVSSGMRHESLSAWFLAMPLVSVVAGVAVIILGPDKVQDIVVLLTGIILICYGINGIADVFCRRRIDSADSPENPAGETGEK